MERLKRSRVVVSKPSSGGCNTCRQRRVKCDKTRPACKNCVRLGRQCPGYSQIALSVQTNTVSPRSESGLPAQDLAGHHCSPGQFPPSGCSHLLSNSGHRHAFEYFRTISVPELMSRSPVVDWLKAVLLTCLEEPLIFHAAALVGTAKRASESAWHTTLRKPVDPAVHFTLLQGYGRILVSLQEKLSGATTDVDIEYVLLTCLLVAVAELYRGNAPLGVRHMYFGKVILKEHLEKTGARMIWNKSDTTKMLIGTFLPNGVESVKALEKPPDGFKLLPHGMEFVSLDQATYCLNNLVESSNELRNELLELAEASHRKSVPESRHLNSPQQFCLAQCYIRTIDLSDHVVIDDRLQRLRSGHRCWHDAFQKLSKAEHLAPQQLALLEIRFFTSMFTLSTCRDVEEGVADRFKDEFRRVLSICEQYLIHRRLFASGPIGSKEFEKPDVGGHMDIGILPALILICCKCRESTVRRRALQVLLQFHRIECFVSGAMLGAFAGVFIALEENEARRLSGSIDSHLGDLRACEVPEEARFSDVVFDGKPVDGNYRVICARLHREDKSMIELFEYSCTQGGVEKSPAHFDRCSSQDCHKPVKNQQEIRATFHAVLKMSET